MISWGGAGASLEIVRGFSLPAYLPDTRLSAEIRSQSGQIGRVRAQASSMHLSGQGYESFPQPSSSQKFSLPPYDM